MPTHIPVLYTEVLTLLEPQDGMRLFDGTLGLAGHSFGLLEKLQKAGCHDFALLGVDRDLDALHLASERLAPFKEAVTLAHGCFADFEEIIAEQSVPAQWECFDFALVDIGVSSLQLDTPERGFSFLHDGPLDMRMDSSKGQSAFSLVNKAAVPVLQEIIAKYGEEPMAGRIARQIDDARAKGEITSTLQLAEIVEKAYPAKWRAKARKHPATRTFQALRMAVNDELGQLEGFLHKIVKRLRPGGVLAVITFHSLEDRLVKHFFREQAAGCICPRHIPVCVCNNVPKVTILTKKALVPGQAELATNSRAASAKLRAVRKVQDGS